MSARSGDATALWLSRVAHAIRTLARRSRRRHERLSGHGLHPQWPRGCSREGLRECPDDRHIARVIPASLSTRDPDLSPGAALKGLPRLWLTVVVTDHAASRQGDGVKASSNSTGVSLPSAR